MNTNIHRLNFDEFGAPETGWKEARSSSKKWYLIMIYAILIIDIIALIAALASTPYSAFDIFLIALEGLVVVILLPKVLGKGKAIRNLTVEEGQLKIQSGLFYRKTVPLAKLERISISKKRNSYRRLVLHYSNGKKEETRFYISLPLMEDRRRMVEWKQELNQFIQSRHSLPG